MPGALQVLRTTRFAPTPDPQTPPWDFHMDLIACQYLHIGTFPNWFEADLGAADVNRGFVCRFAEKLHGKKKENKSHAFPAGGEDRSASVSSYFEIQM